MLSYIGQTRLGSAIVKTMSGLFSEGAATCFAGGDEKGAGQYDFRPLQPGGGALYAI